MKKSDYIITICYGQEEKWSNREQAKKEFIEAIANSEGSEQERYFNIYMKLCDGEMICTDEN
jgi:hypothetical protein